MENSFLGRKTKRDEGKNKAQEKTNTKNTYKKSGNVTPKTINQGTDTISLDEKEFLN